MGWGGGGGAGGSAGGRSGGTGQAPTGCPRHGPVMYVSALRWINSWMRLCYARLHLQGGDPGM